MGDVTFYSPPDEHLEIQRRFQLDYSAAKAQKSNDNDRMIKLDSYYYGEQLKAPAEDWMPNPQTNFFQAKTEEIIANSVSRSYNASAAATEPGDDELADQASAMFLFVLQKSRWPEKEERLERLRAKLGDAILKPYYDPSTEDIKVDVVSPVNCFQDPNALDIDDCQFFVYANKRPLSYIKKRWPENWQYVESESSFGDVELYGDTGTTLDRDHPIVQAEEDDAAAISNLAASHTHAMVYEYWYLADGGVHVAHLAGSNLVVLHHSRDEEKTKKTFYNHRQLPVVPVPCIKDEARFWGRTPMEACEKIQDSIDFYDREIETNVKAVGHPQTICQWKNILNIKKLTNAIGLVLPVRDVNQIKRLEAAQLPPHIPQQRETKKFEMDKQTRTFDVSRGEKPGGVPTATGMALLNEAGARSAVAMVAMKKQAMARLAEQVYSLCLQFWPEEKWLRILGKNGVPQDFCYERANHVELPQYRMVKEVDAEGQPILEGGKPTWNREKLDAKRKRAYFDWTWEGSDAFQITRAFKMQQAKELFPIGGIDIEGLLDISELPEREAILQRLRKRQELNMYSPDGRIAVWLPLPREEDVTPEDKLGILLEQYPELLQGLPALLQGAGMAPPVEPQMPGQPGMGQAQQMPVPAEGPQLPAQLEQVRQFGVEPPVPPEALDMGRRVGPATLA